MQQIAGNMLEDSEESLDDNFILPLTTQKSAPTRAPLELDNAGSLSASQSHHSADPTDTTDEEDDAQSEVLTESAHTASGTAGSHECSVCHITGSSLRSLSGAYYCDAHFPQYLGLTPLQIEAARVAFHRLDESGSGCLDKEKLLQLLEGIMKRRMAKALLERIVELHLNAADKNSSGTIDEQEFLKMYAALLLEGSIRDVSVDTPRSSPSITIATAEENSEDINTIVAPHSEGIQKKITPRGKGKVYAFLSELGLAEYYPKFFENEVDYDTLLTLERDDLEVDMALPAAACDAIMTKLRAGNAGPNVRSQSVLQPPQTLLAPTATKSLPHHPEEPTQQLLQPQSRLHSPRRPRVPPMAEAPSEHDAARAAAAPNKSLPAVPLSRTPSPSPSPPPLTIVPTPQPAGGISAPIPVVHASVQRVLDEELETLQRRKAPLLALLDSMQDTVNIIHWERPDWPPPWLQQGTPGEPPMDSGEGSSDDDCTQEIGGIAAVPMPMPSPLQLKEEEDDDDGYDDDNDYSDGVDSARSKARGGLNGKPATHFAALDSDAEDHEPRHSPPAPSPSRPPPPRAAIQPTGKPRTGGYMRETVAWSLHTTPDRPPSPPKRPLKSPAISLEAPPKFMKPTVAAAAKLKSATDSQSEATTTTAASDSESRRTLSPERMAEFEARQQRMVEQRRKWEENERARREKELAKVLTFHPYISENSRNLARGRRHGEGGDSVFEALLKPNVEREYRLQQERQRLEESQLEEARFSPEIDDYARSLSPAEPAHERLFRASAERLEKLEKMAAARDWSAPPATPEKVQRKVEQLFDDAKQRQAKRQNLEKAAKRAAEQLRNSKKVNDHSVALLRKRLHRELRNAVGDVGSSADLPVPCEKLHEIFQRIGMMKGKRLATGQSEESNDSEKRKAQRRARRLQDEEALLQALLRVLDPANTNAMPYKQLQKFVDAVWAMSLPHSNLEIPDMPDEQFAVAKDFSRYVATLKAYRPARTATATPATTPKRAAEEQECTFHPKISPKAKRLGGRANQQSRFELLYGAAKQAKEKKHALRKSVERQQLAECTFAPQRLTKRSGRSVSTSAGRSVFDELYHKAKTRTQRRPTSEQQVDKECTFKPVAIATANPSLSVLKSPSLTPHSYQHAIEKLRAAREYRDKIEKFKQERLYPHRQRYSEVKPFHFALDERLASPPGDSVVVNLDIVMHGGRTAQLPVRASDDPRVLAQHFAFDHGLSPEMERRLAITISQEKARYMASSPTLSNTALNELASFPEGMFEEFSHSNSSEEEV